ncbi:DMT family transporter [Aestuariivirga sp.]|uniref:DMT family transporter n=1 Tax=Aestuariivirga sp. TaxID=2650926 RepID=UPI0039E44CB0
MNKPLPLLLAVGLALGCNFPLGKLAVAAGVNPALWAALISGGAGLIVLAVSHLLERQQTEAPMARFAVISGLVSYVAPNFLTFAVIPKIGAGLAAIMFALSPVVTALLSMVFRVRPPNPLGFIGIALGLAGAVLIIIARNASLTGGDGRWILLAALIPLFLGAGNVYRTMAWPKGAAPMRLAALTNLAAVLPLLLIAAVMGGLDLSALMKIPGLVAAQLLVSTLMFMMFFRLQQVGGPTYLSQIGYVAAAVGVGFGVALMGETYPLAVWLGVAIVAAGVALSTLAQLRGAKA